MTTEQTEFTKHELLESIEVAAPLVAGGVRCHGGFLDDGTYVSPRTKHRVPAIRAWQAQRAEHFGGELLDIGLDAWPPNYPNVAQSRFLIEQGVTEPIIATLTRIGTVEGFGAMIRLSAIPDLQACFAEDVRSTAMAHLGRGLYEAHARDEAGHDAEGGHKQMWFAARDIAFGNPVTEDETERMMQRMGIVTADGKPGPAAVPDRILPDDIAYDLEMLVQRMVRLLLIEISAFHTFAWAEALLDDRVLVAGEGEASRLVSYIRADETPHVEYLKTVLSEMRDRTFVGDSGKSYAGADMIGRIWDRAVADSLGPRRDQLVQQTVAEVEHAVASRRDRGELLDEFHRLADVA